MDAIAYFNIILRLAIWFLLTADFSLANIIIGVTIAFLLPRRWTSPEPLREWIKVLWKTVVAIPQAYIEAIQIMLFPHNEEEIVREKVKPNRTPGLIFLDIFLITFTPKTIVVKYHQRGWYEVHRIRRKISDQ
ncbi:multisubunit sodium/proton antiporter, MrpE subunit [Halothece sp. PCC 7418]|uniref:Multiple resistance and pH regulation n=1 Tax=Aphanothece halophytica TaxID=72020 RepID=C7G3J2_APHHA|nr:Na+/H+ antiporter subunit E [Halothece sp. PCC 7418]AFZ43183.1 multisubunit sodium/proton antiporter, MrpE subunit [Halothece sp. PCC 7418]BAI23232.1 multiple resistance and pH regulation [Aphanothece halophytica]